LNSAVGNFRTISFQTAGSPRFSIEVNNTAEAGANAGSDMRIRALSDTGVGIIDALFIQRATGNVTTGGELITKTPASGGAGFRLPHGTAPSSPVNGQLWTTTTGVFAQINGATESLDIDPTRTVLTAGEATMNREVVTSGQVSTGNGTLRLAYFQARKTEVITQVRTICGTAMTGSPTVVRVGVYSVDGSGNLTLVASTTHDATLWTTINTIYTKALTASFTKTRGQWYAVGVLVVGSTVAPALSGSNALLAGEAGVAPRLGSLIGSQTDLPSSIAVGSLADNGQRQYVALVP
jgi:hypothetical protein